MDTKFPPSVLLLFWADLADATYGEFGDYVVEITRYEHNGMPYAIYRFPNNRGAQVLPATDDHGVWTSQFDVGGLYFTGPKPSDHQNYSPIQLRLSNGYNLRDSEVADWLDYLKNLPDYPTQATPSTKEVK